MFSKKLTCIIVMIISLLWLSGMILDQYAERRVHQMYARNQEGIIQGLQSIDIPQDKKQAILLVHGFSASPDVFSELVHDIKDRVNSDIYVPLLPFHGRDLNTFSHLDNQIILHDLENKINRLSKQYASLTVVGMSYGGALLTALVHQKKIPETVHVILYAPAFYISSNTTFGQIQAHVYGWWRKYCNYTMLGCKFPNYSSGDAESKTKFDQEKSFGYVVIPAVLQLYQFDHQHREELSQIHRPYDVIIAVDDNRVSYDAINTVCQTHSRYCHLYTFASGKHMIHWGANKKKFEDLLVKLITDPETHQKPM